MNSFDAGRKNETNYPDDNSIMIVTQECNCDRQRAIHLLSVIICLPNRLYGIRMYSY